MSAHLLLVAHGSRRESSNKEVLTLCKKLGYLGTEYASVSCAFLELAEPGIVDALEALVENGAKDIVVVPYFLAAGRHVVEDVPAEIKRVEKEFPDVDIKIAPHFGANDDIPGLLLRLASTVT